MTILKKKTVDWSWPIIDIDYETQYSRKKKFW